MYWELWDILQVLEIMGDTRRYWDLAEVTGI